MKDTANMARAPLACPSCRGRVDAPDAYCRHCGKRLGEAPISGKAAGGSAPWFYQPVWIIVLTLLVLGPLSLPLVWRSPAMSRVEKAIMAGGVLVYTVVVAYGVYWTTAMMLRHLREIGLLLDGGLL